MVDFGVLIEIEVESPGPSFDVEAPRSADIEVVPVPGPPGSATLPDVIDGNQTNNPLGV